MVRNSTKRIKKKYKIRHGLGLIHASAERWPQTAEKHSKISFSLYFFFRFKMIYIFYIPSSYAKIYGETKFQLPEYPRSGSKAINVEEEDQERESESQCQQCSF